MEKKNTRKAYMRRGSVAGLVTNFLLFVIKFFVGTFSGSTAALADSFNNLSDMGSSAVALVGFQMAEKPSDKKHPFGHGRIEYISALVVSFIILFLGLELLGSAAQKIVHPSPVRFSLLSYLLLALSVPAKLALGLYSRHIGRKINSAALSAAGRDSLNDVLVTLATLLSAVLSGFTSFPVDGCVGLLVSAFVIFSGIGILRDTIGPLLGQMPPQELVLEIETRILECPGVTGLHDMIVHNYGPGRFIASAHAEVRADSDILKIHDAIDMAERRVREELGVLITIHLDPVETDDALTQKLREMMVGIIVNMDMGLSMHDFRVVSGESHTNLIFDLVVPHTLGVPDATLKESIDAALSSENAQYYTVITFDRSFV